MEIRSIILEMMAKIAQQQKKPLAPLRDELKLMDSGLDSLCIAILVAELDDEFGIDPLSSTVDHNFPVTVGDFIKLYENAIH
ncbi:phosphopantetheine-binding protein [Acidocella sp. KAb 2-4]|nr:phosphopantetheine-binding protein [Acidocella sp. KAb 2-4]